MMQLNHIYNEDCFQGLKKIPDNSVHSIVTDPPYEIGMQNNAWDSTGIAYNVEFWRECLRVLRPGGYLLAFSATRTYHRMACAIEDAGFEIRDKIDYFHSYSADANNFLKSLSREQKNALSKLCDQSQDTGFLSWVYSQGFPKGADIGKQIKDKEQSNMWAGWNTALKPANEPICMARKPITEKTVAENVQKWGTGALNIDGCRIMVKSNPTVKGRFPTNVILDETAAAQMDVQTGVLKSGTNCTRRKVGSFIENGSLGKAGDTQVTYGDEGGGSRFFYCAKASGKEKGQYNKHPTVKPLGIIKEILKLSTPEGGISLDPFEGSGTHAKACMELGIYFIGFEKEQKYFEICMKRISEKE